MVKNPHKQNVIELAGNGINIIDGTLGKFDLQTQHLRSKTRLLKITVVHINAQNAAGAPLLEFNGMEAAIAADIEHAWRRTNPRAAQEQCASTSHWESRPESDGAPSKRHSG